MAEFVHLHLHTDYSLLDGLIKIPALVEKLQALKQSAVAITDHGNMYGMVEFYNHCRQAGIKPIIGCELYLSKTDHTTKQARPGDDQFHITLLAQNLAGFHNILKLVTIAHFEGFSYKPRIDEKLLFEHQEGIILLSGCMSSLTSRLILAGETDQAFAKIDQYHQVFGDRYYLEIQNHPSIPEEKKLVKALVTASRQFDIPLVATNDVHYLEQADAVAQDALLCVQTRKLISDTNRLKMIDHPDFYLKSSAEMADLFTDYPEAIKNTLEIADRCQVEIPTGQLTFPAYPIPKGETFDTYLKKMCQTGLTKKFKKITPELEQRLDYELDIISQKGYSAYFLITQDFVNWAKTHGVAVGPGRGSAAGSLVSYSLNITTLNPISHGLPFERFLNPQRPTPPDIDIDFADEKRDDVLKYVAQKYGEDHVASVITFGKMEARVAIRDIGRVLGMPYEDPDKIAKLIPNPPGKKVSLEQALTTVPELQAYYAQPKYKQLIDLAKKVEGTIRHSSVHACAVIIADKPLFNYTAIQKDSKSGKTITQLDMYSLDCNVNDDAIGLLKFDFLGLRNLSIIKTTLDLVEKYQQKSIKLDQLPLDDSETFKLLSSGETTGVFQLESAGMRRVAKNLQPSQFSDITAMLALYRPGPMELIPQFIEGKHHPDQIKYLHPSLKPIFAETYGIMVYQEQVMQVFSTMAGYSLGEADIIRRAMGKKKIKILKENKARFLKESQKHGYQSETADQVWEYIMAFANYGFNKSHAASYAMISYQTAYLKAHYPVEYMTALMSVEANSKSATRDEKVAIAIEASKKMGIKVLPPEINHSSDNFTLEKNADSLNGLAIRFSLTAIKNVGEAAIENILATRAQKKKFISLTQFIHDSDSRKVNKTVLESLIKVGAMDQFGTRSSMLENLDQIRQTASAFQSAIAGQDNLFAQVDQQATEIKDNFPQLEEYPKKELLSFEKTLLGLYLTDHPLADALSAVNKRGNKLIKEIDLEIDIGKEFLFGGVITQLREVRTKKNNQPMCFGTLEDQSGSGRFVVFPRSYTDYHADLAPDRVVLMKAKVDQNEGELNLIVSKVSIPKPEEIAYENSKDVHEIFIPRKTSPETLQKLGQLLKSHPGNDQVVILIPNGGEPQRMKLPYTVAITAKLTTEIDQLLG